LHLLDSTDATSNTVLIIDGNTRASAQNDDNATISLRLDDDTGTMSEIAALKFTASDVSAGTVNGELRLQIADDSVMTTIVLVKSSLVTSATNIRTTADNTGLEFGGSNTYIKGKNDSGTLFLCHRQVATK